MLYLFTLPLMAASSLGAGAAVLWAMRTLNDRGAAERLFLAFTIGIGVLGWLVFFAALGGFIDRLSLVLLCLALVPGVALLRSREFLPQPPRLDAWGKILIAAIAMAMVFDFLEGISPPADADSLAYHFAIPKQFLSQGGLSFIPRAGDGAIPLLQQMTYMTALGIGGEKAMTLWSMFTGWAAAGLIYAISRRHMDVNWSLAVTVVFMTTPAVVYGAGSGQVEVSNAMFTLGAAVAVADALGTGRIRYAVLAGLLAGFFVASKYTGLMVAFSCGLTVLFQRRWLAHGAALSAAVLLAGGQWYAWNWWHTGDPLFPMLYGLIDYREGFPWNAAQDAMFKDMVDSKGVPVNIWWLFLYPFKATLDPAPEFQSLRIGFGPYVLMALPLAAIAIRQKWHRLSRSPLLIYGAVCLIAYSLWFLVTPSQLVRHFLPLYPLLLICVTTAANRAVANRKELLKPAIGGLAGVLLIQMGGHGLFTLNYARHVLSGEDRDAFLSRNITGYALAKWINRNLTPENQVLMPYRTLIYLIDVPTFYAQTSQQAVIELRPDNVDTGRLWNQLRRQGITHVVDGAPPGITIAPDDWTYRIRDLANRGCLEEISRFETQIIASRTLPSYDLTGFEMVLWRMAPRACRLEIPAGKDLPPEARNDRRNRPGTYSTPLTQDVVFHSADIRWTTRNGYT